MSINEIYKGLPHELDAELKDIEAVLLNVQNTFPEIARTAAKRRFAYEIARAREIDAIENEPIPEGKKKPTVGAVEAKADLRIAKEMQDEMKSGKDQMAAAMKVMPKYQAQIRELIGDKMPNPSQGGGPRFNPNGSIHR